MTELLCLCDCTLREVVRLESWHLIKAKYKECSEWPFFLMCCFEVCICELSFENLKVCIMMQKMGIACSKSHLPSRQELLINFKWNTLSFLEYLVLNTSPEILNFIFKNVQRCAKETFYANLSTCNKTLVSIELKHISLMVKVKSWRCWENLWQRNLFPLPKLLIFRKWFSICWKCSTWLLCSHSLA